MGRFEGLTAQQKPQRAEWGMRVRAAGMLARGMLRKARFGRSNGQLYVGRGTRLSSLRFVQHTGRLVIEDGVELQGLSQTGLHFGDQVSIGARTAIRPSSYYGGEVGQGMRVGDRSSFATGCFIGCSGTITIGNDVMLGPGVQLHSENHEFADTSRPIKDQGVARSFVTIEDDCWIGALTVVTAGVTIGRGSVIGAGSVVKSDIPPYSIAAGVPARVIRNRLDNTGDAT